MFLVHHISPILPKLSPEEKGGYSVGGGVLRAEARRQFLEILEAQMVESMEYSMLESVMKSAAFSKRGTGIASPTRTLSRPRLSISRSRSVSVSDSSSANVKPWDPRTAYIIQNPHQLAIISHFTTLVQESIKVLFGREGNKIQAAKTRVEAMIQTLQSSTASMSSLYRWAQKNETKLLHQMSKKLLVSKSKIKSTEFDIQAMREERIERWRRTNFPFLGTQHMCMCVCMYIY